MLQPSQLRNNFDLLRLLAAMQVVFVHAFGHTQLYETGPAWTRELFEILQHFPGVPVFFVISGFLISMSWERSDGRLGSYLWKRALRILPALYVCFAVTLIVLLFAGYLTSEFASSPTFAAWVGGQLTFVQFFNPEALRGFGLGVVNASLWTITVELQFYLFIPLFYAAVFGRWRSNPMVRWITVAVFAISLFAYDGMASSIAGAGGYHSAPALAKLLHNTLVPHLWMFMIGMLLHRRINLVSRWVEGRFVLWLFAYAAAALAISRVSSPGWIAGSSLLLVERSLLALLVLSAAYTCRGLSDRLLGRQDISYGVYIYHYLILNVFVEFGLMTSMLSILIVYALTTVVAFASWRLIERPALRLKTLGGEGVRALFRSWRTPHLHLNPSGSETAGIALSNGGEMIEGPAIHAAPHLPQSCEEG